MFSKWPIFYSTISVIGLLLLINIEQSNSLPSDSLSGKAFVKFTIRVLNIINRYLKEDGLSIESMLEEGTSLINQLRDRKRQLHIVIEEHVLSLVKEFRKLWENHQQILDKINHYSNVSEEHINEARMQDESVQEITNRVFDTFWFMESKISQMDFSSGIRMKSPPSKSLWFCFVVFFKSKNT